MKLVWLIAVVASALMGQTASTAPGPWELPATNLAEQVAEILGPGQARLTIRNLSTISTDEIPVIRRLLEQDLKARGVLASGAESANAVRVTLSENVRERLWIAEVVEGAETRVAMVQVEPGTAQPAQTASGLTLRRQAVLTTSDGILALLEVRDNLIAVLPEEIIVYGRVGSGWHEQKRLATGVKKPQARDPHAVIALAHDGDGFTAFLAGRVCTSNYQVAQPEGGWAVHCTESDDPWLISESVPVPGAAINDVATHPVQLKAFYNASRNYFTGMVVPAQSVDLPPFYSAALVPRSDGVGWLIGGIDGRVQLVENGTIKQVAGARDWGSDFAVLYSGCGSGTQIVASGSGMAASDSLRAFELPALEAVPASTPLATDGRVTALWTAPDGKSVFVVVHEADDRNEVDRVTALCN